MYFLETFRFSSWDKKQRQSQSLLHAFFADESQLHVSKLFFVLLSKNTQLSFQKCCIHHKNILYNYSINFFRGLASANAKLHLFEFKYNVLMTPLVKYVWWVSVNIFRYLSEIKWTLVNGQLNRVPIVLLDNCKPLVFLHMACTRIQ